jgi:Dyp-type peroxidase family
VAEVLAVEHGCVLRNEADESIEHFGYVDGRSQPLFLQSDIESELKSLGIDLQKYIEAKLKKVDLLKWDPAAPLGLVLVPDRIVGNAEDCFGSYLVFRKLEQNVRGFKEEEEKLAKALDLTGQQKERAGALVVGRFEDGTPVTLQAEEKKAKPVPNDFNYGDDRDASQCPFHAHIRKVNPRGGTGNIEEERMHRIARRGITYGQRQPTLEDRPEEGVGLLFMCFQSSLANQFGLLQKIYANSPAFPGADTGLDPVIGQGETIIPLLAQNWPRQWGKADVKCFPFGGFVTLKGGEFFFAPSIP